MEQILNPPRRSALTLTAIAYIPALLSMMTVGVIVPFIGPLSRDLAASAAELGLAIALFSLPTAILATMGGGLIDRYGVRRSMLFATSVAALGSLFAARSPSLLTFDCSMLIAGIGFGGLCVSAPCLIMTTLRDGARIRAMSFYSTFAPTGYAAGLLLAVPFTRNDDWRLALMTHGALMAAAFAALFLVAPRVQSTPGEARSSLGQTLARMWSVVREPRALRLGIAVGLPNAVSYGTSLAAPSYLARVHDISIATSSATVAFAKIAAMIIGGLSMGYLLSRAVRPSLLFAIMVAIGVTAQTLLFLPASGIALATGALILWLFAFGGMAGGAMTLLPTVVQDDPARSGAASGLINQFISAASFAAPSTWLALQSGVQYVVLAGACLLISLIALPAARTLQPARTT
jgi:predicted MFS family arabinose efflux permease